MLKGLERALRRVDQEGQDRREPQLEQRQGARCCGGPRGARGAGTGGQEGEVQIEGEGGGGGGRALRGVQGGGGAGQTPHLVELPHTCVVLTLHVATIKPFEHWAMHSLGTFVADTQTLQIL